MKIDKLDLNGKKNSIEVLDNITSITSIKPSYFNIDLRNKIAVEDFFKNNKIDGIIHFAASKAVGESVNNPLLYYENNISTLVYLLQEMKKHKLSNFIFSSSCTVYVQADKLPITENAPTKPAESPYGNTKQIGEEIIRESCKANGLKAIALRYFNPIGAHETANIGELPIGVPHENKMIFDLNANEYVFSPFRLKSNEQEINFKGTRTTHAFDGTHSKTN